MIELIPAILVDDETAAHERLNVLRDLVDWVQLDILDGTLYANHSWHDPTFFLRHTFPFALELHLMVRDPTTIIEAWQDVPNFKRAIWHVEAPIDHHALIKRVHAMGREAGLAITPSTSLDTLTPYLKDVERLLVLGVEPGWSGQTLIPHTLDTVRFLSTQHPHPLIAFDGGVTEKTLSEIIAAGAEAICAASLLFSHPPIDRRLREIHAKLDTI